MSHNFLQRLAVSNIWGLQYIGAQVPLYWSLGSNILEPLLVKDMFFVLFSNMNHGELKVSNPLGRPSRDTQNLVLSYLFLFIPFQNIENKFLRLQYIGAPKSSWLGKKRFEVKQAEHQEKVAIGNTGCPKKRYKLNAAGVTVHRSPVAGIPYFWKLLFWLVSY